MDKKVKGIILKTIDYKEADKLLTILCLEGGKITVKAKAIKKAKSKLKAFCQPFCFANFEFTKGNFGYVLTGVEEIENFYDLTSNIEVFEYAFCVLEIADKICVEGQEYPGVFISILKALSCLKKQINPKLAVIKFCLDVLGLEGINLNLKYCPNCKTPFVSDSVFLNFSTGELLCRACRGLDFFEIEKSCFSALKIVDDCDYEKLKTIKLSKNILDKTFDLILKLLQSKFEIRLKSIF